MSRRFPQSEGPAPDELAFAAPLFTPVFALISIGVSPSGPLNAFDLLLAFPLLAVVSVAFGYIGLLLIGIPVMALLIWAQRLDALRLCGYTTLLGMGLLGMGLWAAWAVHTALWPPALEDLLADLFVGGLCSFGVMAVFCALGKIPLRAQRML